MNSVEMSEHNWSIETGNGFAPLKELYRDWAGELQEDRTTRLLEDEQTRTHARTGRTLGKEGFCAKVEKIVGRMFMPKPSGRRRTKEWRT